MKTFEYKGYTADARPARGLIEAESVKEARERLAAGGVLAERVSVTGRLVHFPAERRSVVYRELGALIEAGLPLVEAFDILIDSPELGTVRMLLATVRDRVREGASLAAALTEASGAVTPFEQSIVEAAERSAMVAPMLERLADFMDEQEQLKSRVQGALIYPALVLGVGIVVAVVMMALLLPRTHELMAGSRIALPWITRAMMRVGAFSLRWGIGLIAVAGVAGAALAARVRRDVGLRRRMDACLFRIPLVGRGYTILVNLRFARTLSILLNGGVGVIDGLVMAGRATGSPWIAQLSEAESGRVRHGERVSSAVRRIPPLAETLPGWLQTGEASGGLARLLESAARRYDAQWDRYIQRCLAFLEPLLLLVIGGFVLLVTLSVLLPVISLTRAIAVP